MLHIPYSKESRDGWRRHSFYFIQQINKLKTFSISFTSAARGRRGTWKVQVSKISYLVKGKHFQVVPKAWCTLEKFISHFLRLPVRRRAELLICYRITDRIKDRITDRIIDRIADRITALPTTLSTRKSKKIWDEFFKYCTDLLLLKFSTYFSKLFSKSLAAAFYAPFQALHMQSTNWWRRRDWKDSETDPEVTLRP